MQLCKTLDSSFNLDRVHFDTDEFIKQLVALPKNSAILLDEAFLSAAARSSMSGVNKVMVAIATEMRQRNLIVCLVLPSIFDLDRYFALWRCKTLIHVYLNNDGSRGQYIIFPERHKRALYLAGKKTYSYRSPRSPFPPMEFKNQYVVNEEAYREKKMEAFKSRQNLLDKGEGFRSTQHKQQRDMLIQFLYNTGHLPVEQISIILNGSLTTQQISNVIKGSLNGNQTTQ